MLNWSLGGSFVCMPVHLLLIKVLNNIWYLNFIYSDKATQFCNIFKLLLSYVVPVKSKVKISQDFVAFSEYMNFMYKKVPFLDDVIVIVRYSKFGTKLLATKLFYIVDFEFSWSLGQNVNKPKIF